MDGSSTPALEAALQRVRRADTEYAAALAALRALLAQRKREKRSLATQFFQVAKTDGYCREILLIQQLVAERFDLKVADMLSQARPNEIVVPRHIAMTLARELTHESCQGVARAFGREDHGTVLYAQQSVAKLRATDRAMRSRIAALADEARTLISALPKPLAP